jgi:hypothetical protein
VRRGSATARRAILLGAAGLCAGRGAIRAEAAETARLVFLERGDCPYCRRWLRDVGEQAWNRSDLGARAPLRRVDVSAGLPADLRFIANWRFTPTFVLVRGGAELGRITGYNGDTFFWQQAESLVARLQR